MSIPMTYDQRCGHLPVLFRDLILRLRSNQQGYAAAMLVEESRISAP
jgi:hypothetical protein